MHRVTRRSLLGLAAVVPLTKLIAPAGAGASVGWCRVDPIFRVDGQKVTVQALIPVDKEILVTGPTDFDLLVPANVPVSLIRSTPGFNGYGENINVSVVGFCGAEVYVEAAGDFEVVLDIQASGPGGFTDTRISGRTNTWISSYD